MTNACIIAYKELKLFLTSPMAYIITAVCLLVAGLFFSTSTSTYMETSMKGFFTSFSLLMLLFSSVLTMRMVAEEKKLGTLELLLTAPLKETEVIVGKYLGALSILVFQLGLTLYFPFLLLLFGDPDIGPIFSGYIGLLLLGSTCLAVGLFASTMTENQILSAVLSAGILLIMWFIGGLGNFSSGPLERIICNISLSFYFPNFIKGIIDTRAIIYYLSLTSLFLFSAIKSLEAIRWK